MIPLANMRRVHFASPSEFPVSRFPFLEPWALHTHTPSKRLRLMSSASLDLGWLERVRRDMPLWEQRREDVYDLKPIS